MKPILRQDGYEREEIRSHLKSQSDNRHLVIANQSNYDIIMLLGVAFFLIFQVQDNGGLEVSLLIMTRNCFCW